MDEQTTHELDIAAERSLADRKAKIRRRCAISISVIWVVLSILAAMLADWSELDLNEWGDYIAGSFAPLALLWLIVGYFQQADELRINSAAVLAQGRELSLQVFELKNQTQAHLEIVSIEREKIDANNELRKRSMVPRFSVSEDFEAVAGHRVTILNSGGAATNIRVVSAMIAMEFEIKPSSANTGDQFVVQQNSGSGLRRVVNSKSVKIRCEDQQGGEHFFELNLKSGSCSTIKKIENK